MCAKPTLSFFTLSSEAVLDRLSSLSSPALAVPSRASSEASRARLFPLMSFSSRAVLADASLSLPLLEWRSTRREDRGEGVGELGEAGSSKPDDWRSDVAAVRDRLQLDSAVESEGALEPSPGRLRSGLALRAGEPATVGLERSMEGTSKGRVRFLGGVERLTRASLFGGRSGRSDLSSALPPLPCSLPKPSLERIVLLAVLAPSLAVCGGLGSWPMPREKAPAPSPNPSPKGSRRALPLRLLELRRPTAEVLLDVEL